MRRVRPPCAIPDCGRPNFSRGYCRMHYKRVRRHGDPHRGRLSAEERFWLHVDKRGVCWLWTGAVSGKYGRFAVGPRSAGNVQAHRFAYELLVGPVPEDRELHHRCLNKLCVNPDHCEPLTALEHWLAHGWSLTHCRNGHPRTPENTYIRTDGGRRCRPCQRNAEARSIARRGQAPKSLSQPKIRRGQSA